MTTSHSKRILLDMDGVLVNFSRAACKAHGREGHIPKCFNFFKHEWGMSTSHFWNVIDNIDNFWLNLEKFPWTDDLLNYLHKNQLEYTICTSPSLSSKAASEKIEWMRKHINPQFKNFLIGRQKYLMSNPNHLLIDDSERNCAEYVGPHILFPSSENRNRHVQDPLRYTINAIEEFYST